MTQEISDNERYEINKFIVDNPRLVMSLVRGHVMFEIGIGNMKPIKGADGNGIEGMAFAELWELVKTLDIEEWVFNCMSAMRADPERIERIRTIGFEALTVDNSDSGDDVLRCANQDQLFADMPDLYSESDITRLAQVLAEDSDFAKSQSKHEPGVHLVDIADKTQVERRVHELKSRSEELRARLAPTLKALWEPSRRVQVVTNLEGFQGLRARFPNFSEVVDYFESHARGLSKIGAPFEAQPILLHGEPGLGKTLFVRELSKVLGLPFHDISMSTASASFVLSGGNTQWENGSVGQVAKFLASPECGVANPIFLIDEIDKALQGGKFNPLNSFYTLLESHSAKRFRDEALEVEIDTSRIIWVATANEVEFLPDAIRSRLRLFEIQKPDELTMMGVISSVYNDLKTAKAYGKLMDDDLSQDVIDSMSGLVPREVRQRLEDAMLKAILNSRSAIIVEDLPAKRERRRVGFV